MATKLGKHEQYVIDLMLDMRILWKGDIKGRDMFRAIHGMERKGWIEHDPDDDNGGSWEFTNLGCELFGFVWNDGLDQPITDADIVVIGEPVTTKKTITCICEYCGIEYQAERRSSRFCKPTHRVAWNKRKHRDAKLAENDIFAQVRSIGQKIDEPLEAYQSIVTLINLKKAIDMYIGTLTRYWKCNNCGKSVMAFLPDETYCDCGHDANWFIVAKKA